MDFRDLSIREQKRLCHVSPLAWAMRAMGPHIRPYPHLRYVESKLLQVGNDIKRLRVSMCPQAGKSLLVSTSFPTWYLGRNPDARVMVVSYGGKRAYDIGQQTKDAFANHAGEMFGLEIDKSARSKEFWKVKGHRGYLISSGVGGPTNGFPADLVIFDDPYGSPEDALSPVGRDRVERFTTSVLAARLQRGGSLVLVSTRWHSDDIIGWSYRIERTGKQKWHTIRLSAIPESDVYDEDTGELVQHAGESICEELKPISFLREIRNNSTFYEWESLWQNRPVAPSGSLWNSSMFGEDVWVEEFPDDCDSIVIAVDPAMGKDISRGDYSAIVALGVRGDGLIYVTADIERAGPDETITRMIRMVDSLPKQPDVIGIESFGFQEVLRDTGAAKILAANIFSPVIAQQPVHRHVTTGQDVRIPKQDRISMHLDQFIRDGIIRFVRGKGCNVLVHQLENFPQKNYHDDGPDALEMCLRLLRDVGKYQSELRGVEERSRSRLIVT